MSLLTGGGYSAFAQVDCRFCMKVPDSMTVSAKNNLKTLFPCFQTVLCARQFNEYFFLIFGPF